MSRQRRNDLLATAIGIVLIGALIQAAGALKHERLVFPDALTILRAFFRLLGEPATYRMMGTSLRHLLEALIISLLIGVPLGLLEGLNRFARHLLKPFISFIRDGNAYRFFNVNDGLEDFVCSMESFFKSHVLPPHYTSVFTLEDAAEND